MDNESTQDPVDKGAEREQVIEFKETLARNLTAARTALELSQDDLSAIAGVSRATIIQIENATGDPRLSTLVNIATALHVTPMFLLLGKADIQSIASLASDTTAQQISDQLSDEDISKVTRLLQSGIARNRSNAVRLVTAAAATAGAGATGGAVGAAIGGLLAPGIGLAAGAALGWLISSVFAEKRGEPADLSPKK
ncbi:MAG: helix-turn-helix domain-containing protein [Bryobacteraceae bacterium]|nr:helix-turn-helix domain-containing protein [Bryobacteraceae bacterium]